MNQSRPNLRELVILGSTGSIGTNTTKVVEHLNQQGVQVNVVGLAAGSNADELIRQARALRVPAVAIADETRAAVVSRELDQVAVFSGPDSALRLVQEVKATDVCAAIVGSAGLPATLEAIRQGLTISLANKETLVAAGALVTPMVHRHGAVLIPVDSEHSAIFQCLNQSPAQTEVKRIVLTASGGPFRQCDKRTMANATVEQALNHPTWNMGKKVTIDSATMMNKALEIIEAHWLFGLPANRISVIIHPQSVVHSFVEFEDNTVLAQLGPPDMRTPIQYALTYPDRHPGCSRALDWSTLRTLAFEEPDFQKFPALRLAYEVVETGGTAGAVFNAANEAAVTAFLERRIPLGRIVELVSQALSAVGSWAADGLESVMEADRRARTYVKNLLVQLA